MVTTTMMVHVLTRKAWLLRIVACFLKRLFTWAFSPGSLWDKGLSGKGGQYTIGRRRPKTELRKIGMAFAGVAFSSSWEQLDLVSFWIDSILFLN